MKKIGIYLMLISIVLFVPVILHKTGIVCFYKYIFVHENPITREFIEKQKFNKVKSVEIENDKIMLITECNIFKTNFIFEINFDEELCEALKNNIDDLYVTTDKTIGKYRIIFIYPVDITEKRREHYLSKHKFHIPIISKTINGNSICNRFIYEYKVKENF